MLPLFAVSSSDGGAGDTLDHFFNEISPQNVSYSGKFCSSALDTITALSSILLGVVLYPITITAPQGAWQTYIYFLWRNQSPPPPPLPPVPRCPPHCRSSREPSSYYCVYLATGEAVSVEDRAPFVSVVGCEYLYFLG